ncbi:MAG: large-conductance mechanosensitive channel protein MscL [Prevotella sp.]|nr:large-conductance mechanosensitive channel protein MscL [Prevotella sp.]MCM1075164.1 large-conductance mechanosensitive channel protein MscL [Ruminococcus sp.]
MGKFLSDFKEFAMRGNVIDMAVGVIIGGAFGKIVSSLVDDIIMPAVGVATGGMDFKDLKYVLRDGDPSALDEAAKQAVTINYGMFIQNIVDFLIIAFCIFMAIRIMQKFHKKAEEEAAAPAPPAPDVELLTEIRDLLKEQSAKK